MERLEEVRKKIGMQKTDSKYLAAFLGSLLDYKETVPCIACGKTAPRRNLWTTFNLAAEARAILGDIAFVRGLAETGVKPPRQDLVLRNGLCPTCLRRIARRMPEQMKIKVPRTLPRHKPIRRTAETSADAAIRYLNQHHVVFDEVRFRALWERSVRLNFV